MGFYKNIIVGAGLSGAIIARKIAEEKNESVLLIDKREHIGGNVYDYRDNKTGITVQKYGPHMFHTNNKQVWDFLSRYTGWHLHSFKPNVIIEGNPVTLPFNLNSIHQVFPNETAQKLEDKLIACYGYGRKIPILELKNSQDSDLLFLANFVYENVFKNYTIKQWGLKPEEIDSTVTARVPVLISYDDRYFQDKYQAVPQNGYTKMIENILNHPNIKVKLKTEYKEIDGDFERVIYTGSIDEYFNYKYGELPYRSLVFDIKTVDKEYYQKTAMVNYPNDYDFTRITEHKHFLDEKSPQTVISLEYPKAFKIGENERYYPISNSENQTLYEKYKEEAKSIPNLYFVGRLGDYKYYNMDLAVERALRFFEEEIK